MLRLEILRFNYQDCNKYKIIMNLQFQVKQFPLSRVEKWQRQLKTTILYMALIISTRLISLLKKLQRHTNKIKIMLSFTLCAF